MWYYAHIQRVSRCCHAHCCTGFGSMNFGAGNSLISLSQLWWSHTTTHSYRPRRERASYCAAQYGCIYWPQLWYPCTHYPPSCMIMLLAVALSGLCSSIPGPPPVAWLRLEHSHVLYTGMIMLLFYSPFNCHSRHPRPGHFSF